MHLRFVMDYWCCTLKTVTEIEGRVSQASPFGVAAAPGIFSPDPEDNLVLKKIGTVKETSDSPGSGCSQIHRLRVALAPKPCQQCIKIGTGTIKKIDLNFVFESTTQSQGV